MRRLATPLAVSLLAAAAAAGCGGGTDGGAASTATTTAAVPADAPAVATLGGVRYAFTGVDCVDRSDGIIADAWGPDGLDAEVYLHAGTSSAVVHIPDRSELVPRSWSALPATVRWSAPVATASGTASVLGDGPAPRQLSVRITCPQHRSAGSGRIRVGTAPPLVPVWVGCRRTGIQEVEVFARGRLRGREWSLILLRRATADGHGDRVSGQGALTGDTSAARTGTGDLGSRPGMFTVRGDRVALTAPGLRLALAGGRPARVTGTLSCGLNVRRI